MELETFKKDINLVEYATSRCGYERIRRESSRASHVLRHWQTNDKIVVGRERDGHWVYFSVRDERDNGSIIDFALRRQSGNLGEVRQELRGWLGSPRPEVGRTVAEAADPIPIEKDRYGVAIAFAAARDAANSAYLNGRGIRPETLQDVRFAATWKEDARGNILFAHHDQDGVSGFELKNRGFTGFAPGGTKAVWHSMPDRADNKLVVVESAIDALSYHQLHRRENERTRYLSLAGAPSPYQLELLDRAVSQMPAGSYVIAAVDADEAGQRIAKQLAEIAARHPDVKFKRDSPEPALGKDWNEVLQRAERDYIRSLPAIARSPGKTGPERSR